MMALTRAHSRHSADIGDVNATFYQWDKPSIPAAYFGKNISLSLEDAKGNEAWSGSVRVFWHFFSIINLTLPYRSCTRATMLVTPACRAHLPLPPLVPQQFRPTLPSRKFGLGILANLS